MSSGKWRPSCLGLNVLINGNQMVFAIWEAICIHSADQTFIAWDQFETKISYL